MKKLARLSRLLSSYGLVDSAIEIAKLAGESEVKYLEELNWNSWVNNQLIGQQYRDTFLIVIRSIRC